jgi:choline kinase
MSIAKRNIHVINHKDKVSVIILAAGSGQRMKSYGVRSLIKIYNGLALIEQQLNTINSIYSNNEIVLVTGFESDKLMNKTPQNIIKIENEHFETTNIARSIAIGLRACHSDKVLLIYGDVVFNEEAIKFDQTHSSLLINKTISEDMSVGAYIDNNNIESLFYGNNYKWQQIAFFTNKELDLLKKFCWNRNNDKKFGFEIINDIISAGGVVKSTNNSLAKSVDIDCWKDLEKVKEII